MPLKLLQRLHRDQKGSAGMEMVLVLPLYGLMVYSVFTLGDLVFQSAKLQAAANYCAFKSDAVSTASVKAMFFYRNGNRSQVTMVTDPTGDDNHYPEWQYPNQLMVRYRSLNKEGINKVTETGNSEKSVVRNILGKAFEGSQTIPHYFAILNLGDSREGGGWVAQRKSQITLKYTQMFPFKNVWNLHAYMNTLSGHGYRSRMENDWTKGEAWEFRDERAGYIYNLPKTLEAKLYPTSGWNAAIFSDLKPSFSLEKESLGLPPLIGNSITLPWMEYPYGDYDGGIHTKT